MTYQTQNTNNGFTIIELLIAIAIMGIIIGALFSFSIAQRKYFSVQAQISEMTQNTRAAMDMIGGELAMAGYRPSDLTPVFSGIPYSDSQLQIYAEFNGNNVRDDTYENITYTYDSGEKQIKRNTNRGGGNQTFSENIQSFTFEYLDSQGNPTTTTANIRQIRLTITGRTSKSDHLYPDNSGYRTYTLTSVITPRNLAY
jgi:type IV pilus assembly protein PilW